MHVEAATHLHRLVTAIRDAGATVGVVLNPATSLDAITEILPEIDLVLVMVLIQVLRPIVHLIC